MDTKFKTMLERTFQVVTFTYSKIVIDVKKKELQIIILKRNIYRYLAFQCIHNYKL